MNKSESKYYNTSLKMYNALFLLLEKKEFINISVKELCDKANINRSTFYSHYDSMLELLNDAKKYIMNEFFNSFKNDIILLDLPSDIGEDYIRKNFIIPYLSFVKENKTVFKVFVSNLKTFNVDVYYESLLHHVLIPALQKKGLNDVNSINYISKFYLTGITFLIMEWIDKDCKDNIEYLADVIIACNKYSIF